MSPSQLVRTIVIEDICLIVKASEHLFGTLFSIPKLRLGFHIHNTVCLLEYPQNLHIVSQSYKYAMHDNVAAQLAAVS